MATASIASSEPVYDPKTDLKWKANYNHPRWKYGFWPVIGNQDLVQCSLCDWRVSGGIKRLKEHLTSGFGDVQKCAKTTTTIMKEMRKALCKGKGGRPLFLDDDEEREVEGEDVSVTTTNKESQVSVVQPSSGTAAKRKQSALQFRVPTANKAKDTKSISAMLRPTPTEVVEQRHAKGLAQSSIQSRMRTKKERHAVNLEIAKFFYECGIPFNAANSRQFEIVMEPVAQYGSGYKPPSYYELREPLLEEVVKDTNNSRVKHEEAWKQYGCTFMSDGWTDRRRHHLINNPDRTFFLESVDASSESHDATMLADLLEKRIEDIEKDKVI